MFNSLLFHASPSSQRPRDYAQDHLSCSVSLCVHSHGWHAWSSAVTSLRPCCAWQTKFGAINGGVGHSIQSLPSLTVLRTPPVALTYIRRCRVTSGESEAGWGVLLYARSHSVSRHRLTSFPEANMSLSGSIISLANLWFMLPL